ncbi:hypothetical protein [Aquabacter sediminis]|uniref:hypothetical protein n=1 Tax=Aquabacter sediminis TaxID=3029197 RepID=UPI00237E1B63|nr:hypothetical protein [Aquabacter sp. P-9]MDE1569627.1 hypothetical protein [Aquabacter sp. P-9]
MAKATSTPNETGQNYPLTAEQEDQVSGGHRPANPVVLEQWKKDQRRKQENWESVKNWFKNLF